MAHHIENFILITLPVENNRERTWQVSSMAARNSHRAAAGTTPHTPASLLSANPFIFLRVLKKAVK